MAAREEGGGGEDHFFSAAGGGDQVSSRIRSRSRSWSKSKSKSRNRSMSRSKSKLLSRLDRLEGGWMGTVAEAGALPLLLQWHWQAISQDRFLIYTTQTWTIIITNI